MKSTSNSITAVGAHEGSSISVVGDTYRIIVGSEQTNDAYAIIDMLIPPGGGPPPHSHVTFQEAFYVIDGEIEVITKEKRYIATKESYVNIPFNGPIHKFTNNTDKEAHILCILTPAGMEKMFKEIGKPIVQRHILTSTTTNDARRTKPIKSIAERYGQKLYPPDYLD